MPLQAWFSQWCVFMHIFVYIYIYSACIVVLSNPGTYGAQKCSSWCPDIQRSKDPESQNPRIQTFKIQKFKKSKNSKTPNTQTSKNPKLQKTRTKSDLYGIFDFGMLVILGFLDFWILVFFACWGFLDPWLCGHLGTKKCISACRRGR